MPKKDVKLFTEYLKKKKKRKISDQSAKFLYIYILLRLATFYFFK